MMGAATGLADQSERQSSCNANAYCENGVAIAIIAVVTFPGRTVLIVIASLALMLIQRRNKLKHEKHFHIISST